MNAGQFELLYTSLNAYVYPRLTTLACFNNLDGIWPRSRFSESRSWVQYSIRRIRLPNVLSADELSEWELTQTFYREANVASPLQIKSQPGWKLLKK